MGLERFREALRNGCVDPWAASVHWKDSPSAPPAPDYRGAAVETAAGNLDATRAATQANRVNQYTPYGNLIYSHDGSQGPDSGWSQNINLSPIGQQLLDYQNNASVGLGQQTGQALNRVGQSLSQPQNFGSVQDVQDQAYKAMTSRLDPQWQNRQTQEETQLTNQGLRPGMEAYDNAMRDFGSARNDAYQQANLGAIQTAPQTFQLGQSIRQAPLNELNALRTGSQVTNPTFNQVPQQQTTAGPNYLGAAQAQGTYDQGIYNAGVGQQNAMMGGLASLGAGALGAPVGASGKPWWLP
jgi:hypothetical protein